MIRTVHRPADLLLCWYAALSLQPILPACITPETRIVLAVLLFLLYRGIFTLENSPFLVPAIFLLVTTRILTELLLVMRFPGDLFVPVLNASLCSSFTTGLYLLWRFFPRKGYDFARRPINLVLLLFVSSFILYVLLRGEETRIHLQEFDRDRVFWEIYSLSNFLPAVLFLLRIRSVTRRTLTITPDSLTFKGYDLGAFFSVPQHIIFNLFLSASGHCLTCRDIMIGMNLAGKKSLVRDCTTDTGCKPSICTGYARIYRYVKDLRMKLERYRIATILTPENKQKIGSTGWRLRFAPDLRVVHRRTSTPPREDRTAEHRQPYTLPGTGSAETASFISTLSAVLFALFMTIGILYELYFHVARLIPDISPIVFIAFIFVPLQIVFLYPLAGHTWRGVVTGFRISIGILVAAILGAVAVFDEAITLVLSIKTLLGLSVVFLVGIRRYDRARMHGIDRLPDGLGIFWILWFFIMTSLVLRRSVPDLLPGQTLFTFDARLPYLHDQLLFFSALLTTGRYLFYRRRVLDLNADLSLSSSDRIILNGMSSSGVLTCREIVTLLYPVESGACGSFCKSSTCPVYQRIYKHIRVLREFLELGQWGTILSPAKTTEAKDTGWRILLYPGAAIVSRRISSSDALPDNSCSASPHSW